MWHRWTQVSPGKMLEGCPPSDELFLAYDGSLTIEAPMDITPDEFLRFARLDLSEGSRRGLSNSLSNAKRGIDGQVERILESLQITRNGQSFPAKVALLTEWGVVAPSIMRRVNSTRNLLEHEFECPKKEDVADALDIAQLFLSATRGLLRSFPINYTFADGPDDSQREIFLTLAIDMNFTHAKIIRCLDAPDGIEAVIPKAHPSFRECLKLSIAAYEAGTVGSFVRDLPQAPQVEAVFSRLRSHTD